MSHIIHNARIIRDGHTIESGWLHYDDHTILAIGQGDAPQDIQADHIDADGHTLMAGFIDVHVHGGASVDTMDADPTALHTMAKFFAQNGVTGFLATTWTDSRERVYAAMRAVKDAQQTSWHDGATLLGVHMEGPYLNIERAGAQNPDHIRRAAEDEMQLLFDLDVIKLLSLAPEFEENHWLIDACAKRGIITSIAHSSATYDQALAAFERGMSHSTHTYNAMTPLHHRKPGIVGAVMQSPHVMAELIADNIHVHPAAMNTLYRIKGADNIVLITDSIRAAGMPDGEYTVDDRTMIVKNGECRLPSGTLAGSIITMNHALKNFQQATGASLEDLTRTVSLNPARIAGVASHKGKLASGYDADLVLLDDDLNVKFTIVMGQVAYRA